MLQHWLECRGVEREAASNYSEASEEAWRHYQSEFMLNAWDKFCAVESQARRQYLKALREARRERLKRTAIAFHRAWASMEDQHQDSMEASS